MKKLWAYSFWVGINAAALLVVIDLLNSPSTAAVLIAIIGVLSLISANTMVWKAACKKKEEE